MQEIINEIASLRRRVEALENLEQSSIRLQPNFGFVDGIRIQIPFQLPNWTTSTIPIPTTNITSVISGTPTQGQLVVQTYNPASAIVIPSPTFIFFFRSNSTGYLDIRPVTSPTGLVGEVCRIQWGPDTFIEIKN